MIPWFLIVVGCTTILTQSSLFFPVRERLEKSRLKTTFLSCPMCVGFWVGLVASAAFGLGISPMMPYWAGFQWIADGCASSLASWGTYLVLRRFGPDMY